MTKFDRADFTKIDAAVVDLVRATIAAGKDRAVFECYDLFKSLHLSRMTRHKFPSALMDVPSGSAFCAEFGDWIIAEVGDDQYVLIKLGDRETPWYDADEFYKANYRAAQNPRNPRSRRPDDKQARGVLNITLPEGMSTDDAQKILAFAASLQGGKGQ